eukprot:84781-Prorocentrum_minimum.AAC.1
MLRPGLYTGRGGLVSCGAYCPGPLSSASDATTRFVHREGGACFPWGLLPGALIVRGPYCPPPTLRRLSASADVFRVLTVCAVLLRLSLAVRSP